MSSCTGRINIVKIFILPKAIYRFNACGHAQWCPNLATSQTVPCQAPLSMEFSRQEYWSRLSFPAPGDLADTRIEPTSPELAGGFFTTESPGKPLSSTVTWVYSYPLVLRRWNEMMQGDALRYACACQAPCVPAVSAASLSSQRFL